MAVGGVEREPTGTMDDGFDPGIEVALLPAKGASAVHGGRAVVVASAEMNVTVEAGDKGEGVVDSTHDKVSDDENMIGGIHLGVPTGHNVFIHLFDRTMGTVRVADDVDVADMDVGCNQVVVHGCSWS
jgi:hypothetical protein